MATRRNSVGPNARIDTLTPGEGELPAYYMDYARGFTTADRYWHPNTAVLDGSASMTRVVVAKLMQLPGAEHYLISDGTGAPDGWSVGCPSATDLCFTVNGTSSPVRTLTTDDEGRVFVIHATYDNNAVRLFVGGTEVGAGSGLTGFAASTANFVIGGGPLGANPTTTWKIHGAAFYDSAVMSPADIQVHYSEIKTYGYLVPRTPTFTSRYHAPGMANDRDNTRNLNGASTAVWEESDITLRSEFL